jgi:hypothetical protein
MALALIQVVLGQVGNHTDPFGKSVPTDYNTDMTPPVTNIHHFDVPLTALHSERHSSETAYSDEPP